MLKFLFISISIILFLGVNANENKHAFIEKQVTDFIEQNGVLKINASQLNVFYITENSDTLISLYYNTDLFVAYNYNNQLNPILAFSFDNGLNDTELVEQIKFFKAFYPNTKKCSSFVQQSKGAKAESHGPLLLAEFGQTNCKNENGSVINVTNLYTPRNVAVGCVAISLASVLQKNQWPIHGSGQHTYTDNTGSLKGEYSANFEDEYYDWENILDLYNYKPTENIQRQALGKLAYHSAVALDMEFESGGSTSNVNKIPDVLARYFKHYGEYASNNSSDFFNNIDTMIIKNSIVPLAVSGNGYGHSVICDGWQITEKENKYYHLNMGWWGTTNGWYQIQSDFNAGGYSSIDGGVFNIVPTPDLAVETNSNKFNISWATPYNISFNGYELQIKIGRNRWKTLSNIDNDSTYQTDNDEISNYAFRVRMKYEDFNDITAWSNMVVVDNDNIGVSENKSLENVDIYPNPAQDFLVVECNSCGNNTDIKIFDMFGKAISDYKFSSLSPIHLDISNFKSGGYIIQISNVQGLSRKLFIKK